jgi:hypothetical protein
MSDIPILDTNLSPVESIRPTKSSIPVNSYDDHYDTNNDNDYYREIDYILINYDKAEYNLNKLEQDIEKMWTNLLMPVIDNTNNTCGRLSIDSTGFLSKLTYLDYGKFYDFIILNSPVAIQVLDNYYYAQNSFNSYIKHHPDALKKSLYDKERICNIVSNMEHDMISFSKEYDENDKEYPKEIANIHKLLYDDIMNSN